MITVICSIDDYDMEEKNIRKEKTKTKQTEREECIKKWQVEKAKKSKRREEVGGEDESRW